MSWWNKWMSECGWLDWKHCVQQKVYFALCFFFFIAKLFFKYRYETENKTNEKWHCSTVLGALSLCCIIVCRSMLRCFQWKYLTNVECRGDNRTKKRPIYFWCIIYIYLIIPSMERFNEFIGPFVKRWHFCILLFIECAVDDVVLFHCFIVIHWLDNIQVTTQDDKMDFAVITEIV